MLAVWKREMQGYFYTPIAYVYMGVFLLISSVLFYLQILSRRSSDLLTFIGQMSYLWMLLSPILTMRLLAEERQRHTDQLLMSSPVSVTGMILGKYLAALTVMLITAVLTLGYVLVIALYGRVYPGELFVGYLGFLLEGCVFIALDLLASELAANQVIAAVLAFGSNFFFWLLDLISSALAPSVLADFLSFFSIYGRSEPFLLGQLSFASVGWLLTMTAACLIITIWHEDRRQYKGA